MSRDHLRELGGGSRPIVERSVMDEPESITVNITPRPVSVIVPTHNRRDLLMLTLNSILAQRAVSFEVIVVDDGSDDGTAVAVQELNDARVTLLRNTTAVGVAAARNRGIANARGDWVAFCDDDDLWAPVKLSEQLAAAHRAGSRWVYSGAVNVTAGYRVVGGGPPAEPAELVQQLERINPVPGGCSGVLVERRLLAEVGGFDERVVPMEDWDLWIRLADVALPGSVRRPLVAYRLHAANATLNHELMQRQFTLMATRVPTADAAAFYRYLGWWSRRAQRPLTALRFFGRAALQRHGSYGWRDLGFDVGYLLRERVNDLRARTVRRLTGRSSAQPRAAALTPWQAEAQAWVDELVRRRSAPPLRTTTDAGGVNPHGTDRSSTGSRRSPRR